MDIKNILINIAKKYNLDSIGIFGSRARGDYNSSSDLDIFIIGNSSLDEELEMEDEIASELNIDVDIIKLSEDIDRILLKNIVNDAIVIYNNNNAFEKIYNFIEVFYIENYDFIHLLERDLIYE